MSFETPPPDLSKLIAAWDEWETGAEAPGKVLSKLKTAGMRAVLGQLRERLDPHTPIGLNVA